MFANWQSRWTAKRQTEWAREREERPLEKERASEKAKEQEHKGGDDRSLQDLNLNRLRAESGQMGQVPRVRRVAFPI